MRYKEIGRTGIKVSSIGLGCMGMSAAYGKQDDKESIATLHRALELGVNFWDTADTYGNGINEELISQVLKPNRDKIFIATKFGFRLRNDKGSTFAGNDSYVDGSAKWLKVAVENSLRRLKIDTIDLYYLHRVDPNIPIEETVTAMASLVKEGKIRYIGLSECLADDLIRANNIHRITAVQSEYSILTRDVEKEIIPLTKQLGISFIPFSPLARGLITNTIDTDKLQATDFRLNLPRYNGEYWDNNQQLSSEFAKIAEHKNITASQLALAWVINQGDNIIPIPGTKHRKYLDENAAAVDVNLTATDVADIENVLKKYSNIGPRYSERENKFLKK